MHREHIWAMPCWYGGAEPFDCVFVNETSTHGKIPSLSDGLRVVRVRLFFSFRYRGVRYPCALMHWFKVIGNAPDEVAGMWIVRKDCNHRTHLPNISVIHLSHVLRSAHLPPVFTHALIPSEHQPHQTLRVFKLFYVNRYIDHHAYEVVHW
ncbi:hypothetical protein CERSUDRAFT_58825 [Gelatoporia subvermispora B]|uniref:Uncharacterized protein n=1 Tax=Ceriporiopsis subvermispora (strain B) TaxID=914234 RepID=M2QJM0_CERS8|nr:hypothetical protein CERSUDRAFT_58825 [Gelatoporia subvermispora B]